MVVTTADHIIEPLALFHKAVHAAIELALEHPQALVTFGIVPTFPHSALATSNVVHALAGRSGYEAYRIQAFKEKPDLVTAQHYLDTGKYYWNSGMLSGEPWPFLLS